MRCTSLHEILNLQHHTPYYTISIKFISTQISAYFRRVLDSKCPCELVEDQEHMWLCEHRHIQRVHLLSEIDHHLTKKRTNTRLQKEIINCFTNWTAGRCNKNDKRIQQIGMDKVMRGYLPADWSHQQEAHRTTNQEATTGAVWAKCLVQLILRLQHKNWKERCRLQRMTRANSG
jgi:hypothetical protein